MSSLAYKVRGSVVKAIQVKDGTYTVRIDTDFDLSLNTRTLLAAELATRTTERTVPQFNCTGGVCWSIDAKQARQACTAARKLIWDSMVALEATAGRKASEVG